MLQKQMLTKDLVYALIKIQGCWRYSGRRQIPSAAGKCVQQHCTNCVVGIFRSTNKKYRKDAYHEKKTFVRFVGPGPDF